MGKRHLVPLGSPDFAPWKTSLSTHPNQPASALQGAMGMADCLVPGPRYTLIERRYPMKKVLSVTAVATALMITPAAAGNLVEVAAKAGSFNTLIAAAKAAGLAGALAEGENLTVFAPTDEAFAALPEGTVESLLKPENKDKLAAILSYHVVPRKLTSNMLPGRTIHVKTIKAGGDKMLAVTKSGSGVTVDGASVVSADIKADNGVIHVIDKVVLPSS